MKSPGWQNSYSVFSYTPNFSGAIKNLIAINILVFILINIFRNFPWLSVFGLVPRYVFSRFMVWQLFTYLFVHVSLWHLVVNMLMLWFFGTALENTWGRKDFFFYYFFSGMGAGLCSFIFNFNSFSPALGASGAIFGILVAYAMLFPENIILLFLLFPMKVKYAVMVLAGINLLGALANPGSGVIYLAQLGGGLFGYLYLKNEWIKRQVFYFGFANWKSMWKKKKAAQREIDKIELDQKVDLVLDKIAKEGIKSLTKAERKILIKKSKSKL